MTVSLPAGRFFFCEHGLAPDAEVERWQRRLEPVWKMIAGGCHLTRQIVRLRDHGQFIRPFHCRTPGQSPARFPKTPAALSARENPTARCARGGR